MTDILERLADLNKQERSHHYVSSVARDAADEIKNLRMQLMKLERLLSAYMTAQRPKAAKKG